MKWQQSSFIFPPRPSGAIPFDEVGHYGQSGFKAQLKFNDTRVVIFATSDSLTIFNRHNELLKYELPSHLRNGLLEVARWVGCAPFCVLDGGLLHFKHAAIKDTFVLWDVLVQNGDYLVGSTYSHRYDLLPPSDRGFEFGGLRFGREVAAGILVPDNLEFPLQSWWDGIAVLNAKYPSPLLEGFVLKFPEGKLKPGLSQENNSHWLARCRVKTGRHVF